MYSNEQKECKKQQMLEECFELFVKQGLENTSMNDLAKYCKTYKAAFYNYFRSKDDIVFECAKMYMEKLDDILLNQLVYSKTSISETLKNAFNILVKEKHNLRYVYQVVSSPKYGEKSRKALAVIYEKYLSYSEKLAEFYSIDKERLRLYYLLFVATVHDFCLWENTEFVNEKLQYIYDRIDTLQEITGGKNEISK